jgi:carboxylate-amine ligase
MGRRKVTPVGSTATQLLSADASGAGRSSPRTIGVEEELLLVDASTFEPVPVATELVDRAAMAGLSAVALELEVKKEQIEAVSPPVTAWEEVLATIVEGRRAADLAARAVGARAAALATATMPCDSHLVSTARYDRMGERFGLTFDEQLTCGFHVHVAVDSAEEGVGVLDRIRPWLPVLLALTANSPFWQGVDTHFASYRYQAWCRWPTAGSYDRFGTAESYAETIARILKTDVSLDDGMIYFDARLSTHAPTVEVRIADVCLRPDDAAAVAVLVRALVETAAAQWRAGVDADDVPTGVLRLASWRASRFGLAQELLDPVTGAPRRASVAVGALLEHVEDGFSDPQERVWMRRAIATILRRGTGAETQRKAMAKRGECADVVAEAVRLTHAAVPPVHR